MKISQAWLWKTAVVVAGTMGGMSVAGRLLGAPEVAWEHPPGPMELFVPSLIGAVLTVSALVYPVTRSALRGGRLLAAVFLAVFGIHVVLVGVEAMVFLVMPTAQLTSMVTTGTVHAALLASLLVLVFGREPPPTRETPLPGPPLSVRDWLVRIVLSSVAYLVLYFVAGLTIFPFVKAFYDTQDMSIGAGIVPLQLLRGALYVAFALPLLRSMVASRRQASVAMAVLFPFLAGVADLLPPNPVLPDYVRPFHIVEIGWSNFVFGWLVGRLFWNPRAGVRSAAMAAPPEEVHHSPIAGL